MIENLNIYVVLITILILVIIFTQLNQQKVYDKLIGGFYNGDDRFCEESEIDLFCLYLDDDVDSHGTRAGYILMKSGDNLVLNEPTTIKLTRHWSWSSDPMVPKYFDIEFNDLNDEVTEFFPNKQTLRFYPTIGKIVLFSGDTIFGVFYKSGYESELQSIMSENDENDGDNDDNDYC